MKISHEISTRKQWSNEFFAFINVPFFFQGDEYFLHSSIFSGMKRDKDYIESLSPVTLLVTNEYNHLIAWFDVITLNKLYNDVENKQLLSSWDIQRCICDKRKKAYVCVDEFTKALEKAMYSISTEQVRHIMYKNSGL